MCLGIPMTVVEGDDFSALCSRDGETRRVSMLLIGAQPAGSRVLVHIDAALRVLDEAEVATIDAALAGVAAALAGESFEHFFADLAEREPALPPRLDEGR